jgi:hypothetical protein
MMRFRVVALAAALVLLTAFAAFGMKEQARPLPPPNYSVGRLPEAGPFLILQAGDTTWVQCHTNETYCPGDPLGGHGGEAVGGPDGSETWCFEGNWPNGDSCGTNPPWDDVPYCFWHYDVRAQASQTGINYWHMDTYRTDQRSYCGDSALWCGSDSIWQGTPVECGTWVNPPGYGDLWNCIAELELPGTFDVANGCTVYFDPRYDTECKYDYFYLEMYDGSQWVEIGLFNATSNNPGSECGTPGGGNPDYWGNTDTNRLANCNWQTRSVGGEPAFKAEIDPGDYSYVAGPRFRWRFESDGAWSDADGSGNTDGAAFVDNVWVHGDDEQYVMDFESGLDANWSFPDPEGLIDQWHMVHDPDPPYEGGDGGDQTTCTLDSSIVYRGRPEGGYPVGTPWRNGWFYRLVTPSIPIQNTGCVVQYDKFQCCNEITCDYTDTKVRFYDSTNNTWCPWINIDGYILYGGCFFWNFDTNEDVTPFYSSSDDSMQFAHDLMDVSSPGDFCRGKHGGTDLLVDNLSVGFFNGDATVFSARGIDILQDMVFTDLCFFNSGFDAYSQDTLNYYADEAYPYPAANNLYVEVTDKDYVQAVELYGTIDGGATWVSVPMTLYAAFDPTDPGLGGEYYGTLCMSDFSLTDWPLGTECWYYVKCTDQLNNEAYYPGDADPVDPDHTGTSADYFTVSVLPTYGDYDGVKILLVDGYPRRNYDYAPCFAQDDSLTAVENMYEEALVDAGYCYDKYDISGGGSNVHVHWLCTWNTDYDAVVWFTGPYFSNYLFDAEAQREMRNYLAGGGKVVLAGDRTAFSAAPESEGGAGEDSLGGEFLSGIMGADYLDEIDSPFTKPYIYGVGMASVNVFGTPTAVDFDTMLVYRGCPYLKDMSWIKAEANPPAGYVVQTLVDVANPDVTDADLVTYVEYQNSGQSVLINFDLCGAINRNYQYCDGNVPAGYDPFTPGNYEGRSDLMLMILEDIFGLPSNGTGGGGTTDVPKRTTFQWALHQNAPNPVAGVTEVRYEVARKSDVSIKVYNAMGQLVTTLVDGRVEPGRYAAHWDGKNTAGERVSSGVYFYKMNAAGFNATKKMLIVR